MNYSIFLSHIHEDQDIALAIKELLEKAFLRSIKVFVSSHEEDIQLGDDWFNELKTSLNDSSSVFLLLTSTSVIRPWVNFEAGAAWFLEKKIIPVCARGVAKETLPSPFAAKLAVNLDSDEDRSKLVRFVANDSSLDAPQVDWKAIIDLLEADVSKGDSEHRSEGEAEEDLAEEISDTLQAIRTDVLFGWRLSDAFPGLRGIQEITNTNEAISRLEILLKQPLYSKSRDGEGGYWPFWWSRGGKNNQITRFERLSDSRCLLGTKEIVIKRLVAVRSFDTGERDFVYVESEADNPVGCYSYEKGEIESRLKQSNREYHYYVDEEYAIWNGIAITREDFDDGSTIIDGIPTKITDADLRVRYLTPYNFIISSKRHVVIQGRGREYSMIGEELNRLIDKSTTIEDLVDLIKNIPRPEKFDYMDF